MSDPVAAGVPTCYRHPGREAHILCQRCGRNICPDCMRPASVGFQCPECVNEGSKSVRRPRANTGLRIALRAAPVTWVLIGLNLVVFALVHLFPDLLNILTLHSRGFCELRTDQGLLTGAVDRSACDQVAGAHFRPGVAEGAYWQLITSVFTHQAIWHVAINMFSLYVLGVQLEEGLGRWRYLALYLISGLAGSVLVYWAADQFSPTLGASGAIFGLMGGVVVLFIRARLPLQQVLVVVALNFAFTFSVSGISWQGHLGGFLGGAVVGAIYAFVAGRTRQRQRVAALAAFVVVLAVAAGARSVQLHDQPLPGAAPVLHSCGQNCGRTTSV